MIVQCKKCETKFRFDEFLIEGEGVWVRCSRCKNVFFLDDPDIGGELLPSFIKSDKSDIEDTNLHIQEETQELAKGGVKQDIFTQPKLFMDKKEEDTIEKDVSELDKVYLKDDETNAQEKIQDNRPAVKERPSRSWRKKWIFLFVILLLVSVSLWFFPEIGNRAVTLTSSTLWTVIEKIQGKNLKSDDVGPAQVQLADIRQRIVSDTLLGTIRIIEGSAINQSSHPMSRIRIKGEITGEAGIVLGVKESYCGNILTSDELATMTDEQIQNKLSNPQGSNVSNDQIAPKRRIPFMIVFTHEPPGVLKSLVVPAGVERLLP